MVQYLREHKEVHDVIVSGGDPLTLPMSKLRCRPTEAEAI
jgi:lysine 2,3-aminomutase